MTILDKHPSPWTASRFVGVFSFDVVQDAHGEILCVFPDGHKSTTDDVSSLILAAPELLAALKCQVLARRDEGTESAGLRDAEALIARIEGGNGP